MRRLGATARAISMWAAISITLIACIIFGVRAWHVAHIWVLAIDEPSYHAGYSVPFLSEAGCIRAAKKNDTEVAQLKARGQGKIAPIVIVRCSHPRFW